MAKVRDGHKSYHDMYLKADHDITSVPHVVQVHLIEGRGLAPNRPGKISTLNPYAVVSVCGRRERTSIQQSTTECLWDNTYVFDSPCGAGREAEGGLRSDTALLSTRSKARSRARSLSISGTCSN